MFVNELLFLHFPRFGKMKFRTVLKKIGLKMGSLDTKKHKHFMLFNA